MNVKKKLRDFFTLTKRAKGGFTLVELIVVIAILAILAGVAIPVYSGYVKKAEKAGDEQLLAAVNKAFTAAVAAAGDDITLVSAANLDVDDGVVDVDSLTATCNGVAADYKADFALFFDGNETSAFKGYSDLNYNATKHAFEGVEGEGGADDDAVIESLRQVIDNSNYKGQLDELTGNVGELIDALSGYLNTEGSDAVVGTGFDEYLTNVLGMNEADKTDTDKMANAAVLYLAHGASGMNSTNLDNAKATLADAIIGHVIYDENRVNDTLISELAADTGSGMASYAMLYATAKALALQEGEGSAAYIAMESADINNPQTILTAAGRVFESVDTETLEAYFEEGAAEGNAAFDKDMAAYFQTLQAVNGKESNLKTELDSGNLLTENATVQELLNKLKG